uniref:GRF-type domain-containing protein n=2 Tax=Nicotiana TaxID=4085 RepID=A0A1S3ZNL9_TOBAC|nr:PREDICTED: uncharacterized protein LOC104233700 [Nicotiana sylvestris]XP_016465894.1 PREDICTED: uncharacterized protein LOC107788709 [Nicotiana tabacum]
MSECSSFSHSRRRMCGCGVASLYLTSRSEIYPGRCFFKCHKPDKTGCGYWEWEDDEFPPRAIIFINKLKREKDALLKERLGNMVLGNRVEKLFLMFLGFIIGFVVSFMF